MPTLSTTLVLLGCFVFIILGVLHAALMLFSTKFEPRDPALLLQLKTGRTWMSKTGNLWKGITGFHLSHSLGLVLFGWFYITLAIENPGYLKSSVSLTVALLLVPITYLYLSHRYWFNVPRNSCAVALALLGLSVALR